MSEAIVIIHSDSVRNQQFTDALSENKDPSHKIYIPTGPFPFSAHHSHPGAKHVVVFSDLSGSTAEILPAGERIFWFGDNGDFIKVIHAAEPIETANPAAKP